MCVSVITECHIITLIFNDFQPRGLKTADHKATWSQNIWLQDHELVVSKQLTTWSQNSWSQGHVVFMAVVTDDLLTCEAPGYLRNPETQKEITI